MEILLKLRAYTLDLFGVSAKSSEGADVESFGVGAMMPYDLVHMSPANTL
ncbi:MAG TPA: hypothetical protein VK974_06270 [Methylophilaceae bacterium]|nr:hypothetical protein [Methylophilaceae bacterium]